jgi:uncharacterized protein (TIGR04255 family)
VASDLDHLAPANGVNAIVNAAFAIDIDGVASDPSLVTAFQALAPQMTKDGFEPPQPQMVFTMNVGTISSGSQQLGGFSYVRKNAVGQPSREFAFRANTIVAVVHDYTRWHLIWPEVQGLYARALPSVFGAGRSVQSVALQYIDRFTWRKDGPFPTRLVLRADSPLVVPAALELGGPWHNQFGAQREKPADHWANHLLENVNLSVTLDGGFHALTIFTIYRYFARGATKDQSNFVTAVLPKLFNEAHDDNKQLLRKILTDEVSSLIKLNE